MSRADFEQVFGIVEHENTQAELRVGYHRRLLADLRRFVEAAGLALGRDLGGLTSRLVSLDGQRLSPGMALAHIRLLDLASAPQPINENSLTSALELLEETLEQGVVSPRFRVDTVYMQDRWERDFVSFCMDEMDKSAPFYPSLSVRGRARTLPADRLAYCRSNIDSVLATLQRVVPSTYRDVTEFISELRIFEGSSLRGASSPSYFGAVLIREPNPDTVTWLWFADHLTHEAAHHRLYIACGDDPLVATERTVTSPVRSDPRPLSGVMHALWVEARLVTTFRALAGVCESLPVRPDELEASLAEFEHTLAACIATIEPHVQSLTPVGRRLLEHCSSVQMPMTA